MSRCEVTPSLNTDFPHQSVNRGPGEGRGDDANGRGERHFTNPANTTHANHACREHHPSHRRRREHPAHRYQKGCRQEAGGQGACFHGDGARARFDAVRRCGEPGEDRVVADVDRSRSVTTRRGRRRRADEEERGEDGRMQRRVRRRPRPGVDGRASNRSLDGSDRSTDRARLTRMDGMDFVTVPVGF